MTYKNQKSGFCLPEGFKTWWKLNPKLGEHEHSAAHIQNFLKWKELEERLHRNATVDGATQA